ncbi:hypothetical protein TNCV_4888731 [Trichonephila clavipes]|nr:hypothetical protein TNCV_4888731 [Trichonephila clavipes]
MDAVFMFSGTMEAGSEYCFTVKYRCNLIAERILIWRKEATRNLPSLDREILRFGFYGSGRNGYTEMRIFQGGSVTTQRFVDEILKPHVRQFRAAFVLGFLLMSDNARGHIVDYM